MRGVPCVFHIPRAVLCGKANSSTQPGRQSMLRPPAGCRPLVPSLILQRTRGPPATWPCFRFLQRMAFVPYPWSASSSPVLLPTPHPRYGLPVPLLFQVSPETSLQGACPDRTPHSSALNYSACIFRAFHPLSDVSSIKAAIRSVWLKV